MKDSVKMVLVFAFFSLMLASRSCDCEASGKTDVALWLARSCVGEAGFDSGSTGECAAIASVYRKRADVSRFNLYQVIRKYSAAVKPGPHQSRRWVFHLSRDLGKPKQWNTRLRWSNYRGKWEEVLSVCDDFVDGKVPDPVPLADHYGGWVDRWRARKAGWFKIKTPFRNDFWSITDPRKKASK